MKSWIYMLILFLSVTTLCIWDAINTSKVFENSIDKSEQIYNSLLSSNIENEQIKNDIHELNEYWTKKMDTLVISISRKDLQPVSDYLQYLYASTINNNQEEAITYSRLLHYNLIGLKESTGISIVNLL